MCAILTVICCNCLLNAHGKFTTNPKRTVKSNFQPTLFLPKTKDEPKLLPCGQLQMHEIERNTTKIQTECSNYKRSTGGIEGYYKRKSKIANPRLSSGVTKKQNWNDYTKRKFVFKEKLANIFLRFTVRKPVQMNLEGKTMLRRQTNISSLGNSSSLQQNSSLQSTHFTRVDTKYKSSKKFMSVSQQNSTWMFNKREGMDTNEKISNKYPIADVNKSRSKHNNIRKHESRGKRPKKGVKRETLLGKSFDIETTHSQTSIVGSHNEPNELEHKPRDLTRNEVSIISSDTSAIDPSDRFHHNHSSEMNIFSMKTKNITSTNNSIFPKVDVILPSNMFLLKPNDHSVATSVLVTKRQIFNIQTSTPEVFAQAFPLHQNVETGRRKEKTKESEGELPGKFSVIKDMLTLTDREKCNNETETDIDKQETTAQKIGNSTDFRGTVEGLDLNSVNCQVQVPPAEDTDEKVIYFKHKYPVKLWTTLGLYDDTYLDVINSHWLSFEPPNPIIHKVFATIYGIFMVVGCGGNLLVIFMFVRCRTLRTPPNYLIANLAISDFLMMAKTPIYILNSLYQGPVMGALGTFKLFDIGE
ncbi:unnamed protein product [Orchesella dallaii]|uniref:G-protein coupled receptors family 1 profile domain-containing protein n=1 Tax=Orchesella dallaii TaxID=48710 RepID=A0ABP1QXW4_9HEXA